MKRLKSGSGRLPALFSALLPGALILLLFLFTGCRMTAALDTPSTIRQLANHMIAGTGARWFCVMEPYPVHAESGFSLWLNNRQVAFYKYNPKREKMKKKLNYVNEHHILYNSAIPYPAIANGPFVMVDYEAFPPEVREKLIDTFMSFR